MRLSMLSVLLCALPLTASAQSGPGATVPYSLREGFGNSSTTYPFAEAPNRFQQVIPGGDLRGALDIRGIALRKDDRVGTFAGRTIELEIRLGYTTKDSLTLTTNFATNFDSGPPVVVLARRSHVLVGMPNAAPSAPSEFFHEIPFDQEFLFRGQGRNLLLEVVVFGNEFKNLAFAYPLDSGTGTTATTLIGNGPTAANGVLNRGQGLVLRMLTPAGRCAAFAHMFNGSGPVGRRSNSLTGGNPPLIGSNVTLDLNAPTYDFAALLIATKITHQVSIAMPGYRVPIYVDPATLVVVPVGLQSGFASLQFPVPSAPVWKGLDLAWQGIMASNLRPDLLGATNLVLANLGTSMLGSATFAMAHMVTIGSNDWLKTDSSERVIVHQAGAESADKIVIQGSKSAGELIITVENGQGVVRSYSIPASQETFSQTVDVDRGERVYFFNKNGSLSMSLTYEVTVVR